MVDEEPNNEPESQEPHDTPPLEVTISTEKPKQCFRSPFWNFLRDFRVVLYKQLSLKYLLLCLDLFLGIKIKSYKNIGKRSCETGWTALANYDIR